MMLLLSLLHQCSEQSLSSVQRQHAR